MKYLELTEQKAKDLNELCEFALGRGVHSLFDINYYHKQRPDLDKHYCRHLLDVAKQYQDVNKLIDLSVNAICATHNTEEFLKSGGFSRILEIEKREDNIQDYTLRTLRQNTFATKDWIKIFLLTTGVSIAISLITSLLVVSDK